MVGVKHGLGGSVEDAAVEANQRAYFLYLYFYEINFAVLLFVLGFLVCISSVCSNLFFFQHVILSLFLPFSFTGCDLPSSVEFAS